MPLSPLAQHEYVARPELCSQLMLSLIKVLEAPHPKGKPPAAEDMDDDKEDADIQSSNVRVIHVVGGREGGSKGGRGEKNEWE